MSLEVYVANGNSAVTQKAKLPLDVQLLQEEQTMARHVHLHLLHTCIENKSQPNKLLRIILIAYSPVYYTGINNSVYLIIQSSLFSQHF